MADDQLIAQTRHLAVAGVVSDPPASGSPAAASVPASMAAGGGDSRGSAAAAAAGDDGGRPGLGPGDATGNAEGRHGLGGEDRGVRLGRSTAVAALGTAAGARPVEELEDCLVGEAGAESLSSSVVWSPRAPAAAAAPLERLPVEVLFHVMGFLDVNDLLSASRTSHHLRSISLTPLLHVYRLQRTRVVLPPLLWSPSRPSLADLIARSIFLTQTTVVSRRLARSLVSIRLARRLAARPSPETLAERAVLPRECLPPPPTPEDGHRSSGESSDGSGRRRTQTRTRTAMVSPALVQQKRRVERERIKDGLRRWVGAQWLRAVREKGESVRRREESCGVGRVWRLTRFWERVSRGEAVI